MNYLKMILSFEKLSEASNITSSSRSLYYALLNKNNNLAWMKSFTVANSTLQDISKLNNRVTFERARQQLIQLGLIKYEKGKGGQAPSYELVDTDVDIAVDIPVDTDVDIAVDIPVDTDVDIAVDIPVDTDVDMEVYAAVDIPVDIDVDTLNKYKYKYKQNININNSSSVKKEKNNLVNYIEKLDEDEEVKKVLLEFIKMRKVKKKPLTEYALSLRIKELNKLTTSNSEKIEIINQSITSNWDRFYKLTDNTRKNISYPKNNNTQFRNERVFDGVEDLME